MNEIHTTQNKPESLERLAMQRHLYSSAKRIFTFRTIVALVIAVASPFVIGADPNLEGVCAVVGFAYLVLDFFLLKSWESGKKEDAAKIQESFDTELYGIPWNFVVVGDRLEHEKIAAYRSKIIGKNLNDFLDWYPNNMSQIPLDVARTICQRTNVWWDSSLRRIFAWLLRAIVIIGGVILFILIKDETVWQAIIIFAPFAPIMSLLAEQISSHTASAKRLDSLKKHLEDALGSRGTASGGTIEVMRSRSIQDEIFRHRCSSTTVPNAIYWILRGKYENGMLFSAQKYIDDYLAR